VLGLGISVKSSLTTSLDNSFSTIASTSTTNNCYDIIEVFGTGGIFLPNTNSLMGVLDNNSFNHFMESPIGDFEIVVCAVSIVRKENNEACFVEEAYFGMVNVPFFNDFVAWGCKCCGNLDEMKNFISEKIKSNVKFLRWEKVIEGAGKVSTINNIISEKDNPDNFSSIFKGISSSDSKDLIDYEYYLLCLHIVLFYEDLDKPEIVIYCLNLIENKLFDIERSEADVTGGLNDLLPPNKSGMVTIFVLYRLYRVNSISVYFLEIPIAELQQQRVDKNTIGIKKNSNLRSSSRIINKNDTNIINNNINNKNKNNNNNNNNNINNNKNYNNNNNNNEEEEEDDDDNDTDDASNDNINLNVIRNYDKNKAKEIAMNFKLFEDLDGKKNSYKVLELHCILEKHYFPTISKNKLTKEFGINELRELAYNLDINTDGITKPVLMEKICGYYESRDKKYSTFLKGKQPAESDLDSTKKSSNNIKSGNSVNSVVGKIIFVNIF